jgi:flagellar biosynthesis chaperone FliJ
VEPFPLTTLLALRQREEETAQTAWSQAQAALRAAEARVTALGDEVEAARGRLEQARAGGEGVTPSVAVAEAANRQRFVARRRDEWTAARAVETAFRAGPLAAAQAAEATARQAHVEKRRGREAVEKQKEQWLAEALRQQERRAEDARDDVAAAARHRKMRDP